MTALKERRPYMTFVVDTQRSAMVGTEEPMPPPVEYATPILILGAIIGAGMLYKLIKA